MNQSLNISDLTKQISAYIRKGHWVVLFLFISIMIGITTISVTNMLSNSTATDEITTPSTQPTSSGTSNFSKDPTLEKIRGLEFSNTSSYVQLPKKKRINPFAE